MNILANPRLNFYLDLCFCIEDPGELDIEDFHEIQRRGIEIWPGLPIYRMTLENSPPFLITKGCGKDLFFLDPSECNLNQYKIQIREHSEVLNIKYIPIL
jgi:hypothetical protein